MEEEKDSGFEKWDSTTLNHDQAHARQENLDPKVNGPFLDDVRAEQEEAYRTGRAKSMKAAEKKKKAAEKKAEADNGSK